MKIKTAAAVWFSPAGSTGSIVRAIAKRMADFFGVPCREYDLTLPAAREAGLSFSSDELVIFGMPTYAGRVPNKLLPFLQNEVHGSDTPVVPVVTFGNRSCDSSLAELQQTLADNGFRPFAAAAFACRHVFSAVLAAGRPDADDLRMLDSFALRASEKLSSMPSVRDPAFPLRQKEPVRPYYTPLGADGKPAKFLKAKPKTDPALCTGCGICSGVCPMGSIDPQNVFNVPGICIKCQACVLKCPVHAKYFDDAAFLSHISYLEAHFKERKEPELRL